MTSRQWREIAEAFDTPPERRTERQQGITAYGLCYAYKVVSGGNGGELCKALSVFEPYGWAGAYLVPWPHSYEGDTLRAGLAALFAAMNQKERDEVLGRF